MLSKQLIGALDLAHNMVCVSMMNIPYYSMSFLIHVLGLGMWKTPCVTVVYL